MRPTESPHPIGKRGLKLTTQSNHGSGSKWGFNIKAQFVNIREGIHSQRQQVQNVNKQTTSMEKNKIVTPFRTERVTSEKIGHNEKNTHQLNSNIQKRTQKSEKVFVNAPQTRTNSSYDYAKPPMKKIPLRHLQPGVMKNQEASKTPRESFPSQIQVKTPQKNDIIIEQLTQKLKKLEEERNLQKKDVQKIQNQLGRTVEETSRQKIIINGLEKENERIKIEIEQRQKRFENLEKIIFQKQEQIVKLKNLSNHQTFEENTIQALRASLGQIQFQLGTTKKELTQKNNLLDQQKLRVTRLSNEKRLLLDQYHKLDKIRKLVKQLQGCKGTDKAEDIKIHIAYEIDVIDANRALKEEALGHLNDIQFYKKQYQNICIEMEIYKKEFEAKASRIIKERERLQEQVSLTREEVDKVRKEMMQGNQGVIQKLKIEILNLKEKNMELSNNSQEKIKIIKLERDNKILNIKIAQLHKRNKELEESCSRLENMKSNAGQKELTQTISSTKNFECFDVDGVTNLPNILRIYEERSLDLTQQIQQRQNKEQEMVKKIEKLEAQSNELKGKVAFFERKQQSMSQNNKNKLQSIEQTLKAEIESLTRKIQTQEESSKRKNREIAEKDKFITNYLLTRIKDQRSVDEIIVEIGKYFQKP